MLEDLKKIGIAFQEPQLVEEYYKQLKGIMLQTAISPNKQGFYLDLDSLPMKPVDFKSAVIKWLIYVNLPRLRAGQDAIITMELALKCPVWRVIKAPIRKLTLSPEGMFNNPTAKTVRQKAKPGSINKR